MSDARQELEIAAVSAYRRVLSVISPVGTVQLLSWANQYFLQTVTDPNDCDFQVFVLSFFNRLVRSSSYCPRRNGIITPKTEKVLIDALESYYERFVRIRDMQYSLQPDSVILPSVIHPGDIQSMSSFFVSELEPYSVIIRNTLGVSARNIVSAFASMASTMTDPRRQFKTSGMMILPQMGLGSAFAPLACGQLCGEGAFDPVRGNLSRASYTEKPLLRLDGVYYCFAPQLVFPYLVSVIRNAVCSSSPEAQSLWNAIGAVSQVARETSEPEPVASEEEVPAPDESVPATDDEQYDVPDEEEIPDFEPEEPEEDIESDENDEPTEEPEPQPYDFLNTPEEPQEPQPEEEEVPESVQPSLFKEIVLRDGVEYIIDSPMEESPEPLISDEVIRKLSQPEPEPEPEPEPPEATEPVGEAEPGEIGRLMLSRIRSNAASSYTVSSYLDRFDEEAQQALEEKLEQIFFASAASDSAKFLTLADGGISVCVVGKGRCDSLRMMEIENSIAAVMLVNERITWNAFIITPTDTPEHFCVQMSTIKKDGFTSRRWKLVQQLGWKLYLQRKKQDGDGQ